MLHSLNKEDQELFGQELILNLYSCDPLLIRTETAIRSFVIQLCDEVICMKRFGEPLIPHFGHANERTSGYSLVQLIETSSITGHFSEYNSSAYLNIFSCAWFDAERTAAFCSDYFRAERIEQVLVRRG